MYTLTSPEGGSTETLNFKGNKCYCPYTGNMPCNTLCPQFEINTKSTALGGAEKHTSVTLHCTGRQITIGQTA